MTMRGDQDVSFVAQKTKELVEARPMPRMPLRRLGGAGDRLNA